jgi:hypothetical protein
MGIKIEVVTFAVGIKSGTPIQSMIQGQSLVDSLSLGGLRFLGKGLSVFRLIFRLSSYISRSGSY